MKITAPYFAYMQAVIRSLSLPLQEYQSTLKTHQVIVDYVAGRQPDDGRGVYHCAHGALQDQRLESVTGTSGITTAAKPAAERQPQMKAPQSSISRRDFMSYGSVGMGLAFSSHSSLTPAAVLKNPTSPEEFKRQLRGPILSVPTTYTSDFKVDYDGMRRMIEGAAKAGVRVFALTNGNNQYDRLTYDEIKQLTQVMIDTVAGRGVTIAATGPWWTGPAVDYARFAESIGADSVQVLAPAFGDDDSKFEHYRAVAAATRLGLVVHGPANLALMKRLAEIDSVVAIKAEFTVDFTASLYQLLKGRWNIFQGGQKSQFLAYVPYGMQAYYSTFSTFAPEVAMNFWNAVERNDLKKAGEIVLKYDVPFFQRWSHPFWRATLEHFGVASRYLRPPERTFTDAQIAEVKTFFNGLGLQPK